MATSYFAAEGRGDCCWRVVASSWTKEFKLHLADKNATCWLVIDGHRGKFSEIEQIAGKGSAAIASRAPGVPTPPDRLTMIPLKVQHAAENVTNEARLALGAEATVLAVVSAQFKRNSGAAKSIR